MGLFNFVKDAGEKLWDAVTGQHDKHRGDQASHRVNKVIEIDFRHVAQHQQANVHQRRPGRVGRHQIRERGEEQDQQEQDTDRHRGQTGFTTGRGTRRRFDINRRRRRPD